MEEGRLWFDAAHPVDVPCLDDAPSRGFAYITQLSLRLDAHTELQTHSHEVRSDVSV